MSLHGVGGLLRPLMASLTPKERSSSLSLSSCLNISGKVRDNYPPQIFGLNIINQQILS